MPQACFTKRASRGQALGLGAHLSGLYENTAHDTPTQGNMSMTHGAQTIIIIFMSYFLLKKTIEKKQNKTKEANNNTSSIKESALWTCLTGIPKFCLQYFSLPRKPPNNRSRKLSSQYKEKIHLKVRHFLFIDLERKLLSCMEKTITRSKTKI